MTDDIEELRQQTQSGSRIEQETSTDDSDELQEAIVEQLDLIEKKDVSPNLTMRDGHITALVRALEDVGRLDEVGSELDDALGNDPADDYNRADIGRLAIRIALADVEPELIEDLEDAVAQQIQI